MEKSPILPILMVREATGSTSQPLHWGMGLSSWFLGSKEKGSSQAAALVMKGKRLPHPYVAFCRSRTTRRMVERSPRAHRRKRHQRSTVRRPSTLPAGRWAEWQARRRAHTQ